MLVETHKFHPKFLLLPLKNVFFTWIRNRIRISKKILDSDPYKKVYGSATLFTTCGPAQALISVHEIHPCRYLRVHLYYSRFLLPCSSPFSRGPFSFVVPSYISDYSLYGSCYIYFLLFLSRPLSLCWVGIYLSQPFSSYPAPYLYAG